MENAESQNIAPVRYITSLDGIRALCILAVMGHHFGYCDPGWIGVEMFFVLSGFLITTLMCREYEKTGQIALLQFWARRAFRLLPIYWLYIGAVTIAVLATRSVDWNAGSAWTPGLFILSLWGYFANLAPARMWTYQIATYHLWSLAIEEQFYFCWPFLCIFALKLKRPWVLPFLIFVISLIPRVGNISQPYAWLMTYAPIGIIIGCTVALISYFNRSAPLFHALTSTACRNCLAIVCIVLLMLLEYRTRMFGDDATRPWAQRWFIPLYVWPFAVLIAGLWYGPPLALGRALSFKPLAYLGKISYGMYLYHMVLIDAVKRSAIWSSAETGLHLRFAMVVIIYVICVISIASLSYQFIEKPFLQIGSRFRAAPRSAKRASKSPVSEPLHMSLALKPEA